MSANIQTLGLVVFSAVVVIIGLCIQKPEESIISPEVAAYAEQVSAEANKIEIAFVDGFIESAMQE